MTDYAHNKPGHPDCHFAAFDGALCFGHSVVMDLEEAFRALQRAGTERFLIAALRCISQDACSTSTPKAVFLYRDEGFLPTAGIAYMEDRTISWSRRALRTAYPSMSLLK
jgi:hypothetical protein